MPKGSRNNLLSPSPLITLQSYAQEKLRIVLDPSTAIALDASTKAVIDAAAVVAENVAGYAPQASGQLRTILRTMLQVQINFTIDL